MEIPLTAQNTTPSTGFILRPRVWLYRPIPTRQGSHHRLLPKRGTCATSVTKPLPFTNPLELEEYFGVEGGL